MSAVGKGKWNKSHINERNFIFCKELEDEFHFIGM